MPWTAKDAPKKIKGKDRAKWASIANAIYKDCMKKGTDKECAPKAKRIANSKFNKEKGEMKTKKVPRGALRIVQTGEECFALAEFVGAEGEKKKPKLRMTAYSGGIIKDHWYWNDLVLDLQGAQFEKKFPILENHSTDRKVAFSSNPILENGKLEINPDKTKFVETEISAEFQRLSSEGFPYQCSVFARPSVIERISEGATAEANGITLRGPGTIFRKWIMKEASVCVFGWDSKTSATAFSKEEVEIDMTETEIKASESALEKEKPKLKLRKEVRKMNIEELMEKYPDLLEKFRLDSVKDVEVEFAKKETKLNNQITALNEEKDELSDRVLGLEKKESIRAEKELKASADRIWTKKLSESEIPETLHEKVCKYVSYTKFTKKGILDVEKFEEAIDAEIKDWEDRGVTSEVIGTGFSERSVDEEELSAEDQKSVDDDVDTLLVAAGDKTLADKNKT